MSFYDIYDPHLSLKKWFNEADAPAAWFDIQFEVTASTAYTLAAATGYFVLTGESVHVAYGLGTSYGSFVLTGESVHAAYGLGANVGTFSLTGESVHGAYGLGAGYGSFSLTGESVHAAYGLGASQGSFALTGEQIHAAYGLGASQGSFALTGESVHAAYGLGASYGNFIVTGETVNAAYTLGAQAGIFSLTGFSVGTNYVLEAQCGFFNLTGENVGFQYNPAPIAIPLGAGPDERWSPWLRQTGTRGILQRILPPLEVPKKAPEVEKKQDYFDQIAARVIAQYEPVKIDTRALETALVETQQAISAHRVSRKEQIERIRLDGIRRQREIKAEALRQEQIALQEQERLHAEAVQRAIETKRRIERDNEDIVFLLSGMM